MTKQLKSKSAFKAFPRVAVAALLVALAGFGAVTATDQFSPAGFTNPTSPSISDEASIREHSSGVVSDVIIGVRKTHDSSAEKLEALGERIETVIPGATVVTAGVAEDGQAQAVSVEFPPISETERIEAAHTASELANSEEFKELDPTLGGPAYIDARTPHLAESDLLRSELLVFPLIVIVLLCVFRSIKASVWALAASGVSIAISLAVLNIVARFMEISVFALNMTVGLGLALTIDYSLLIISRYREERQSHQRYEALQVARNVTNHTIWWAALTVAVGLAGMLVFPFPFLRSIGIAGIVTSISSAAVVCLVLPAMLRTFDLKPTKRQVARKNNETTGGWQKWSRWILQNRLPAIIVAVAILASAAWPVVHLQLAPLNDSVLSSTLSEKEDTNHLRDSFPEIDDKITLVSVPASVTTHDVGEAAREAFSDTVEVAPVARGNERTEIYMVLDPEESSFSAVAANAEELRSALRTISPSAKVAGEPIKFSDQTSEFLEIFPYSILFVLIVSGLMIAYASRSLTLPIKAIVVNLLNLGAAFGICVFIFQLWQPQVLTSGFSSIDGMVWTMPMLIFCITYGLSMDYEMFILLSIREEHDKGKPNHAAIEDGISRNTSVITAAALLIASVFLGFIFSDIIFMREIGVTLVVALLLDAFLVRTVLVPTTMSYMGKFNWVWPRRANKHTMKGLE